MDRELHDKQMDEAAAVIDAQYDEIEVLKSKLDYPSEEFQALLAENKSLKRRMRLAEQACLATANYLEGQEDDVMEMLVSVPDRQNTDE